MIRMFQSRVRDEFERKRPEAHDLIDDKLISFALHDPRGKPRRYKLMIVFNIGYKSKCLF